MLRHTLTPQVAWQRLPTVRALSLKTDLQALNPQCDRFLLRLATSKMSGASQQQPPTAKLQDPEKDKKTGEVASKEQDKAPAILEEDDEFEDFPVEGTHSRREQHQP